VLTVIMTKMKITVRSICITNSDVTITGRFICRANSYFDNNDNNREVYVQC
jgi:hypothetical protein